MNFEEFQQMTMQQKHSLRVMQRNLVYVNGLDLTLTAEELGSKDFFGYYGKIVRISPNKNQGNGQVYVLYEQEKDAVDCIYSVHGSYFANKMIKAQFGTSKYCTHFLQGQKCTIPDCPFLHEFLPGNVEDSSSLIPQGCVRETYYTNRRQRARLPPSWNKIQRVSQIMDNEAYPEDVFIYTAKKISYFKIGKYVVITGFK